MTDDSVFGTDDVASGTSPNDTADSTPAGAAPDPSASEPSSGASDHSSGGGSSDEGSSASSGDNDPAGASTGTDDSGNSDAGNDSSTPSAPVPASTGPGVNSVILDAVKQSNSAVLGASGNNGAAIAYQKVAQAAAFAVQDSTDYLRNIMAMSSAATGVALKKMVENPATAAQYTPVLTAAQDAVTAAQTNFQAVGTSAGSVVSGFPSGS